MDPKTIQILMSAFGGSSVPRDPKQPWNPAGGFSQMGATDWAMPQKNKMEEDETKEASVNALAKGGGSGG